MSKQLLDGEIIEFLFPPQNTKIELSDEKINEKYVKGDVRIITEQARYPLNTILTIVNNPSYILNPEFQRRHRWGIEKKSKLIESFIMNVPIPPVFLYEISFSEYEVMDGLQRLTAISQFYKDEFALEGLMEWKELNGRRYSELPEQIQKGIDRRYLSSIILLQETAKNENEAQRLKQLVFERINSGGEKLTAQETRNALYPGKLNSLCLKLARDKNFCQMWNIPEPIFDTPDAEKVTDELTKNPLFSRMEDAELVLRFFAYRQIEKWEGVSLETFLDEFLLKGNFFAEEIISNYAHIFKRTISLIYSTLGETAFWLIRKRKFKDGSEGEWKYYERPTKVLYDPLMYLFSNYIEQEELLLERKEQLKVKLEALYIEKQEVLGGRNTNRNDVLSRIELINQVFENILS